jgi:tyrosyl-tRNA synthetase
LLLGSDGSKLGKTAGARTWLGAAKTTPFQFHQHFVNLPDDAVEQQLPTFSLRPLQEIRALLDEHRVAPERRLAQRALADEMTELVHGQAAATTAAGAADVLFGGDPLQASADVLDTLGREVPVTRVSSRELADPVGLLVTTQLASSRSDARRLLEQRSTRANGVLLGPGDALEGVPLLHERYLLLRKGNHTYHLVEISREEG